MAASTPGCIPFIRDVVDAEVARRSLAAPRSEVRIVPAMLGVDAPLIGAAEAAFEPLLADPTVWLASVVAVRELRECLMSGTQDPTERDNRHAHVPMKGVA